MNRENRHWGKRELNQGMEKRLSLRSLIHTQLPETRIFVDRLHREFTTSGRRMRTNRLIRNKSGLPWFMAGHDGNA